MYLASSCAQSPQNWMKKVAHGLLALVLLQNTSVALYAYDFPLSETAIRGAYFLGIRPGNRSGDFLKQYTRNLPGLKVEECVSFVRLETPFYPVVDYASRTLASSAQDAEIDFRDKPLAFRMHFEICYMPDAPPNSVKIRIIQNNQEVDPGRTMRSAYFPPTDAYTSLPSIGEYVDLEVKPEKFDSSTLTIVVATPDGQHSDRVRHAEDSMNPRTTTSNPSLTI
jgi:hypothetical protein